LALSKHLYPVFGDLPLSEITIKQIEDYKGARRRARNRGGKSVSEATVNRELCALKVVLKKAAAWGKLEVSPGGLSEDLQGISLGPQAAGTARDPGVT